MTGYIIAAAIVIAIIIISLIVSIRNKNNDIERHLESADRYRKEIKELKDELNAYAIHETDLMDLAEVKKQNDDRAAELSKLEYDLSIKQISLINLDGELSRRKNDLSNEELRLKKKEQSFFLIENDLRIAEKEMQQKQELIDVSFSNLSSIPYMAKIVADYETIDFEEYARKLNWGYSKERAKKVATIRQIRAEAKERIEAYKYAEYQLNYLKNLYPEIEDIIETEFSELPKTSLEDIPEHDFVRDYLSREEWNSLSTTERNQLALDRYVSGHSKSKWQIGRDYELYIGYVYMRKGYSVDYYGSYMKLEDLGRDLIVKKAGETRVVQCKYWSQKKTIREKHIAQLHGTTMCYCMEHNCVPDTVKPVFVTNTEVSDKAKEFAEFLGVDIKDSVPMGNYPRIKCNIGHGEYSSREKIYHLPFDLQYDSTKIDEKKGEFFAMTVAEAEAAGFRRAFKWHGN